MSKILIILPVLLGLSLAQRPPNASSCDYYATARFGSNSSTTQFQLIQDITALAFGGGFNLSNISSEITGILNPGTFQNVTVDLRQWFNGSIDSTNLNDQAVGINWLDEGGTDPLYDFLSGQTANVVITNTTNEGRLFSHFFSAFAHIFGCTLPPPPPPSTGGPLSLAYVHKFMNLNSIHLGFFIEQVTLSAQHFGFSELDGQTFNTEMNSLYNVRCAPPITINQAQGPELLSLCQNPTCPLAQPIADCAAYVNLTADGTSDSLSSALPSSSSTIMFSSFSSTSTSASATHTSTLTSIQTITAAAFASSSSRSSGAIAGIVIGSIAALAMLVGLVYFYARRQPRAATATEATPAELHSETTYVPPTGKDPHMSYTSNGATLTELESPRFPPSSPSIQHSPQHSYFPHPLPLLPVEVGNNGLQAEWDPMIPDTINPEQGLTKPGDLAPKEHS